MSAPDDDDDDYLSDKFLLKESTSKPSTYSQIRKEALRKSQIKNEQNRTKGRRQREIESREEGLSKSLFERAKEDEAAGIPSSGNKALSIMMKMGFKPGQSLGNLGGHQTGTLDNKESPGSPTIGDVALPHGSNEPVSAALQEHDDSSNSEPHTKHKVEPLPLQEWAGRKGIGLGKRARSPSAADRLAKMAKLADDRAHGDFRERARDEYKNRQAEKRLAPAQLTCTTLDEQMGKVFNVLWLNPNNPETFPKGLIDALSASSNLVVMPEQKAAESIQSRLKKQMEADALQPLNPDDNEGDLLGGPSAAAAMKSSVASEDQYSRELLEEAAQFLRLQAQDRLSLLLSYLRDQHAYCFWCGVKYDSEDEMDTQCPGPKEEDHD